MFPNHTVLLGGNNESKEWTANMTTNRNSVLVFTLHSPLIVQYQYKLVLGISKNKPKSCSYKNKPNDCNVIVQNTLDIITKTINPNFIFLLVEQTRALTDLMNYLPPNNSMFQCKILVLLFYIQIICRHLVRKKNASNFVIRLKLFICFFFC